MSATKPAIVIVPGAWHVPAHYSSLENDLITAGYEVTTCLMPSTGPPEPLLDMSQDIRVVQKAVQSFINRGLDVVLVMHSLGGFIGGSACKGMRPQDQPSGKGVVGLVYLAAFALPEGESFFGPTAMDPASTHAPWVRVRGEPNTGIFMGADNPPYDPRDTFYNGCKPEVKDAALKMINHDFSESLMWVPCEYSAWKEIESNYLICELDNAIPEAYQDFMSTQAGGKWKRVERLHTGHSPWLSHPEVTLDFVRRCAGEEL